MILVGERMLEVIISVYMREEEAWNHLEKDKPEDVFLLSSMSFLSLFVKVGTCAFMRSLRKHIILVDSMFYIQYNMNNNIILY